MNESLHPFRWIPKAHRKKVFITLLGATLLVSGVLTYLGQGLESDAAPMGIVSFEFVGDLDSAAQMIQSWGRGGQALAGFHLGLDYLFLMLYSLTISLGCVFACTALQSRHAPLSSVGPYIAWAQFLAALLDAIENAALYGLLIGTQDERLPLIAWWCAAIKFAIVAAGLLFVLLASISTLMRKFKPAES